MTAYKKECEAAAGKLGLQWHPDHALGEYSIALPMPAEVEATRRANNSPPFRTYLSIDYGSVSWLIGEGTDIHGSAPYDTENSSVVDALSYALASARRANDEWVANYKPLTAAEFASFEAKIIS